MSLSGIAVRVIAMLSVMRILALGLVLCLIGQVSFAEAGPSQGPCEAIVLSCKAAGYFLGGAGSGRGIWNDCVSFIMQGKRPANAGPDFPTIAPDTIGACHRANPKFGMPADLRAPTPPKSDTVFWVSNDQTLNYPRDRFLALPDEHQTFLPMPKRDRDLNLRSEPPGYYLVAAMLNKVDNTRYGWTFLLQTRDLLNLILVPGAGDPAHGNAIFWTAHPLIALGPAGCNYTGITHFDEQYAAPGSVLQDPTQPPGNRIMIYESEIHCPYSSGGGAVGWISIGVAHSQKQHGQGDGDQMVWPRPVAAPGYENNWLDYGNGRYAGLTIPGVPQTTGEFGGFYGNSLPSAFIDDVSPSGNKYLYVLYNFTGSPAVRPDGKIHIARAKLGPHNDDRTPEKLQFRKWYNGGWNAPGVQTQMASIRDDGIDPVGCEGGTSADSNAQLTYNEALGLYMLTYACHRLDCRTKPCTSTNVSWYYRTTHDLSTQNWSVPQLIENSTHAAINKTDQNGKIHSYEDGDYPTFMTPGCAPGHIGLTGYAFLLDGDPLGDRVYARRRFVIKPVNSHVRNACGSDLARE